MSKYLIIILLCFNVSLISGQVYFEKKTRHRFAQMNFGLDYQTNFGGQTIFINEQGLQEKLFIGQLHKSRVLIGGTHFWGHADLYLSIPLFNTSYKSNNQEIFFTRNLETVFKYYPLRIKHNKIRPFVGTAMASFYYEQNNKNLYYGKGPKALHTTLPLLMGFTFNNHNQLLEIGLLWNYVNKKDYYISRIDVATIKTPPLYVNLSYRYIIETTLSAEKDWESGQTAIVTQKLAEAKKLNGLFLGIGMSSAWWMGTSSYNQKSRPYIPGYGNSIMTDLGLGYYIHKTDLNISFLYRGYNGSADTYGAVQNLNRKSIAFEATKYFLDYHGFAPFAGPVISYEQLKFKENFENIVTNNNKDTQVGYGITVGWDIRPNRVLPFLLRTNLRYFPHLKLKLEDNNSISFDNIEFNFIQLIIFPNRIFKRSV